MEETPSVRKLAENEVYFRQLNEKSVGSLRALKALAKTEGQEKTLPDLNKPLQFFCECSDEKCRLRIRMKPSLWRDLHKNNDQFIVVPGHIIPEFERSLKLTKTYEVIEKLMTPPKEVDHLNQTDLSHK